MLGSEEWHFAARYGCGVWRWRWSTGRAVLVQREEGECMALSQQAHLGQVGWGCKPRDEGGKEGEGPCVPVQCQCAQGLCFMLLSVLGQLTAGKGGCVAGAWASECLMGDPLGRRRCLYLLVLQSFLGLLLTQSEAGFSLLGCLPELKVALESCLSPLN